MVSAASLAVKHNSYNLSRTRSDSLNQGGQTDVIVMDFSKAFDKVDHQRLLLKLNRIGISSQIITWIGAFLAGRSQSVVLDGENSDSCPVQSGVPNSSVLGPCLFLLYINDMPDTIHSNIRLFTNDTIMYMTVSKESDCQALQRDLSKLEQWENERLMSFNPDKCEVIRLIKKRKPATFEYKLHGKILKSVTSANYLGVTVSLDVSWATHINQITTKTNNTLKIIKRNVQTHSSNANGVCCVSLGPVAEYIDQIKMTSIEFWDTFSMITATEAVFKLNAI